MNFPISILDGQSVPMLLAETSAMSWGVIGFCIILGLMVTLGPNRRTTEIKNPYND